jgi:uroporphyrin-III C-methyltransferase
MRARALSAPRPGKVWLVGAGPGDPELVTLKAVRAMREADVLLVDELVDSRVLQHAPPSARVVRVGKRGGCRSTPQAFIERLMVRLARRGYIVARVKGGDPFVFGRGGEELARLRAAGITVEVASGVTAGIAVPGALGIPVTHRGVARGVVLVTGHAAGGDEPDWATLARSGLTLAIYMGLARLEDIATRLVRGGLDPATPAVAVQSGTLYAERVVRASVATLPAAVAAAGLASPTIVIVGDVVALGARVAAAAPVRAVA